MKKQLLVTLAIFLAAGLTFGQNQTREGVNKSELQWSPSRASITVQGHDGATVTDQTLVEAIVGTGVTYSNISYIGTTGGTTASAGLFANGGPAGANIGVDEGIILCSGWASDAIGPNVSDGTTQSIGTGSDSDLNALIPQSTNDRCVLEFDFIPEDDEIFIEFVFASEEYNEFVNSSFNDVFAFFVNGVNIALIPTTNLPVSINNVNNGNPFGTTPNSFPQFYNNNDPNDPGPPAFDFEPDGFTDVFTGQTSVNANQTNHIKLAIADASDSALDSYVLIKAESFTPVPPGVPLSPWALFLGALLIAGAIWFRMVRMNRA